ncbi:serine hydrolase domain-containing protein [Cellvibrio mixtus]|uniref:serine hydrolase domain-containing protein n=1 Tax=Cellvibrio mixtus TaxID=39650 RepID=UPI000A550772|nr:serine hydrolase domain-containing protein [Cellvibrio mixtus]
MFFPTDFVLPDSNPRSTDYSSHPQSRAALDLLEQHKTNIHAPAISAAVAIDGKIVWAGATGWANIEKQIPVTTGTQFRTGSTAKALTGTLLAKMVQEGKINLDTPIANYHPHLPNKEWEQLTPRQLASHTSGIPDYIDNTGDWWGFYHLVTLKKRYLSANESLEVFDGTSLLFEPGTQYHYATFNTVLLSAVLETIAGETYLKTMHQKIFTPLNMAATDAEYESRNDATLADFYWNDDGRYPHFRRWRTVDLSHRLAGGGFVSTPSDLVKLGSAWLDDSFISPHIRQQFWQPQVLASGEVNEDNYALGWRWADYEDEHGKLHNANHGGVSRGSQCWLMVIPEQNMAVAVMINSNVQEFWDFGKVSIPLARLFLKQ